MPGASEGLSQPDVDFEGVVARASRHRQSDIQPDGPDRRVIPHPGTGADAKFAGHRFEAAAYLAGIHEYGGAEIGAEALPQLQTTRLDRGTADGQARGGAFPKQGPTRLEGKPR